MNYTKSIFTFAFLFSLISLHGKVSLQGEWELALIHQFAYSDTIKYPQITWNNEGTRLFASWGKNGNDLGVIDVEKGTVTSLKAGNKSIDSIAYKRDGADGLMTISGSFGDDGQLSEARLWDISSGTSRIIIPGLNGLQSGVSGSGNLWGVRQYDMTTSVSKGFLILNDDKIIARYKIPPVYGRDPNSIAPLKNSSEFVFGIGNQPDRFCVGCFYDPIAKGAYDNLYIPKSNASGPFVVKIKQVGRDLIGCAWFPVFYRWEYGKQLATAHPVLPFINEKFSDDEVNGFDVNEQYAIAGLADGTIFVTSIKQLDTSLCSVKLKNPATCIQWNPSKPSQCAIATSEGVYVFQMVQHVASKRNIPKAEDKDSAEKIYRTFYGFPRS